MSSHQRSTNVGLQLSRTTKGIQNSRRSIRGLGSSGGLGSSAGSARNLGDGLARLDNKGSSGKKADPKKKPSLGDDLSIDESVPSVAEVKARKEREERRAAREGGRGGSKSSLNASSEHGRSTFDRASRLGALGAFSDHVRSSGRAPRRGSLDSASAEDSQRLNRSASSRFSSSKAGSGLPESISGLVRSSKEGKEEELNKSLTFTRPAAKGINLPPRSATYNGRSTNAVQGIYKILNSMEPNKDKEPPSTTNPKDAALEATRARARRTKSADDDFLAKQRVRTSLNGIRNLLDKKDPQQDTSPDRTGKETNSRKERISKRQGERKGGDDDSSASEESEDNVPVKVPEMPANARTSLQGIHKLLGTMGHDPAAATIAHKERGEEASPCEESKPVLPADESDSEGEGEESNDYDTVATPKTAPDVPLPPMKEAPPPPQRRNMARKPRNQLPTLGPQKAKAAPLPAVPATPMRSPGGFLIDMQNQTKTPVACSTPQQSFSTPQAMPMPVVPGDDFDSVGTPRSVANVAPPPIANAPPPPPKRNTDMGSRWKNRQNGRVPEMPGQQAVAATPKPPKAPSMTMLSPGGIVIEVNSKKSGIKGPNRPPEPMTPMCDMTPMGNKSGMLSNSPQYNTLRNSLSSKSPLMTPASQRNGVLMEMNTPSMRSCCSDDISELTPGTMVGGSYRTTPRQYNSPGVVSELTPGGYSVGLYGDDDYQGTFTPTDMQTPSLPTKKFGVIHELTPGKHGILLEEEDEDETNYGEITALPSTPSLQSPAGVVTEGTPMSEGSNNDQAVVGPPPLRFTTSMDSHAGLVSELTTPPVLRYTESTGTRASVMSGLTAGTTPSVQTPSGVVSEEARKEGSRRDRRMLTSISNHSGTVSEVTVGTFSTASGSVGQVQIAG